MDHLIGDCGHAYDHTFKYPDCTGKFHYSDATCEYDCLVSEYEWWSLTTLLGGQDGTGAPSHRGVCHLDTPVYILYGETVRKRNEARLNDSAIRG